MLSFKLTTLKSNPVEQIPFLRIQTYDATNSDAAPDT